MLCITGGHGWSQSALGAQERAPVQAHLRACLGAREHLGGSVRGVEGSAGIETGGPARPRGRGEAARGGEGRAGRSHLPGGCGSRRSTRAAQGSGALGAGEPPLRAGGSDPQRAGPGEGASGGEGARPGQGGGGGLGGSGSRAGGPGRPRVGQLIREPPERAPLSGRRRPRGENCCVPGQSGRPCGRARGASKCEAPALRSAPRIRGPEDPPPGTAPRWPRGRSAARRRGHLAPYRPAS